VFFVIYLNLIIVIFATAAAQLAAEADKPPYAAPAGRAGSFSARRTASRRLQTLNVNPLVHRGKRRAACPLARECGLQLNV
jgi:hypothetical protein